MGLHRAATRHVLEAGTIREGFDDTGAIVSITSFMFVCCWPGTMRAPAGNVRGLSSALTSKTVAEGDLFDREFDQIAEIYEPQLRQGGVGARQRASAPIFCREQFRPARGGRE